MEMDAWVEREHGGRPQGGEPQQQPPQGRPAQGQAEGLEQVASYPVPAVPGAGCSGEQAADDTIEALARRMAHDMQVSMRAF